MLQKSESENHLKNKQILADTKRISKLPRNDLALFYLCLVVHANNTLERWAMVPMRIIREERPQS